MQNLNSVFLSGRVVGDAVVREFSNGGKITVVRMASSRSFKSGEEWKERTTFIDCEAGGKVGERLLEAASKGTLLSVNGSLESDEWEKDGEKRSKIKIRLNDFEVNLPKYAKRDAEEQEVATKPAPAPQAARGGARGGFRSKNNGNQSELANGLPF